VCHSRWAPFDLGEIAVEGSKRPVAGLPGHCDHQTIREPDRRTSAKLLDGCRNGLRVLQRQALVITFPLDWLDQQTVSRLRFPSDDGIVVVVEVRG
jgi:hypothetical protein